MKNELGFVDMAHSVSKRQFMGIQILKEQPIDFVLFNQYTNLDESYMQLVSKDDQQILTALDLMFLISFVEDIDELAAFMDYHKKEPAQVFSWGGISDIFTIWKREHGHISKGAQDYSLIYAELETSATYILSLFTQWQDCFPFFLANPQMGIPEQWNITLDENNAYQFVQKGMGPQGGAGFLLENSGFLFVSFNLYKIQVRKDTYDVRMRGDLISGLNERFVIEYRTELGKIALFNQTFVKIQCNSLNAIHEDGQYVNVDSYNNDGHTIELSYTVDCKKLIDDIIKCENRKIESEYLLQLLTPLFEKISDEFQIIRDGIIQSSKQSKTVNIKAQKVNFYMNPDFFAIRLEDKSLLAARKTIAIVAYKNGVMPGKYERKNATKVVRKMQESLVKHLEDMIQDFERLALHAMLMHYYAIELIGSYTNQEGYSLTDRVAVSMQQRNKEKLIAARKSNKEMQSSFAYLIESNLFLNANRGTKAPNISDIENMVAFSHWLGSLQSNSDMCFHTTSDTYFIVLDDYRVDVEFSDEYQLLMSRIEARTYESDRYGVRGDDTDRKYFMQVSKGFYEDTGVEFQTLEVVLRQLMECGFSKKQVDYDEIRPNVVRINKADAVKDVQRYVIDCIPESMVQKAYDFITLSPDMLKTIGEEQHNILPVWEREKRRDRFEVKPLLSIGDSYIYSPVIIKELHNRWVNGWLQFYPPYEIGLTNALGALWKWKEHYEHKFSSDICDAFRKKGYAFAESDVDIRRRDRKGNHPSVDILGDYDVIALDTYRKRVFIIECKVLQPVGSVFEHSMQQKRFFLEEKYDEKFQRRIDYFKSSCRLFFENVGCGFVDDEYSFEAYMFVNKVFASYYKKIDFPIITFDELARII